MPFDGVPQGSLAVQMFDWLEAYFADGDHWLQGAFSDGDGRRCLVSALAHLRAVHQVAGDRSRYYIGRALRQDSARRRAASAAPTPRSRWLGIGMQAFNDSCTDYGQLRAVLQVARDLAKADAAGLSPRSAVATRRTD